MSFLCVFFQNLNQNSERTIRFVKKLLKRVEEEKGNK